MPLWKKKMVSPAVGRSAVQSPYTWRERTVRSLPIYGIALAAALGIFNSSHPAAVRIAIGAQMVLMIVSIKIWS